MIFLTVLLAFFLGASIGSFYGVVVDRLPRHESIISPPSHCTQCGHVLTTLENIPILSWLFLHGSCKTCGSHIPAIYFWYEFFGGCLFAVICACIIIVSHF